MWRRWLSSLLAIWLLVNGQGAFAAEAVALDPEAAAWLTAHGPLKLAPDPDFAPVDYLDSSGRQRGLSADLLALLSRHTGLRSQIVRKRLFSEVLKGLEAGEVDFASSVFKSPARAERMLFSNSYLRLPAALIARRDAPAIAQLAELRGRKIAVVSGHVWQELLTTAGYAAELRPARDIATALRSVADKQADAYVGDLLSADPAMRKAGLADALLVTGQSGLEAEIGFAIRKDLPELKRVLDQALATISVEEEAALRKRWEGPNALAELEADSAIPPTRVRELAGLRTEVEAQSTLPQPERETLLQRLGEALSLESAADQSITQAQRIAHEVEQAQLDSANDQSLNTSSAAEELLRWRGSLPQRATLGQLEQLLVAEQTARASLQETLTRLNVQADELAQRPAAARAEVADLQTRLDAVLVPEAGQELASKVEREAALAQTRALRAQMAALVSEQVNIDALMAGADARKRERQRALAQRNERVSVLEQLIAERSDSELAQERERLKRAAASYAGAAPAIRDLANENLASGDALTLQTKRLAALREQSQRIDEQSSNVATALQNAKARIAIGGVTESVGMLLLAERRRLSNPSQLRAQLTALQRESAEVQLAQISLSEERDRLNDLGGMVQRLAGSDAEGEAALSPEERATLTELLLTRAELLPRLLQQQQKSREVLEHTEKGMVQLLADSRALQRLMEQNLLWIPSHRPVAADLWQRLAEAWHDLLKPGRWQPVVVRVGAYVRDRPWWIVALLLPWLMLLARPRLGRVLDQLAGQVRNVREDRYRYTLQALAASVALALPMALFWWLLGQVLQLAGDAGRFSHSVGMAMQSTVPYLCLLTLTSVLCRLDGVAHVHLRWPRARRTALQQVRPYLYFVVMPLAFLVALSVVRDVDPANGTVLRSTLVALHLTLAAICGWLLAPERLLASRVSGPDPRPGLRRMLRVGLVSGFAVLALITLLGYLFTSATLLLVFLNTLQVLFVVTLVHGLALRWLVLGERRIALAQQRNAPSEEHEGAGLDVPAIGLDSVNLRTISTQSRSLLRALTVVSLAAGLLWSLADVAPAFSLLDQLTLWDSSSMVDGVAQVQHISLGDCVLALAALLIGITAARNIPGLLEIALLQRFTADASVRYAAVAVTRYLISFSMVVAVLGLLGVRWGHLQWLAAGFSVGLGFGLQEIFGNFVAGLILLFERPFRVGDVVTIGDLTGTVRRVRTRATTIVDFDNKDIVIPNKTFITDRFVNWTLTDTVTRIVLRVGVGYECDPEQVRAALLQLAHANPAVLPEPVPVALFMALADSTMNFELRCFVRDIGDRLRTTDELHSSIVETFRARGIRLAYPQMDVHLHPVAARAMAPAAG